MATYTSHYNLKKPASGDYVNVADLNGNADIIDTELYDKVDKETGKGLSTNDYTTEEKTKLAGIESGAQVNPSAASANPLMDGTASAGSSSDYARGDHVHPSDTTKVDKETGKGLSTNDYTDEDKAKLAELSQYVGAGIIFDTASGSMASFTDGGDGLPVKSAVVNVDPVQDTSGGAPSPTNICPITGHTSAAITREGTDSSQTQTYDITFPTEAGTVYGGVLDVTQGKLTVNMAYAEMGSLGWYLVGANPFRVAVIPTPTPKGFANTTKATIVCDMFETEAATASSSKTNIIVINDVKMIMVYTNMVSSVADFKTLVTNHYICYELLTPVTYTLTQQEITTLLGINHVWADTGDVSVEYAADPKLYINKVIANVLNA